MNSLALGETFEQLFRDRMKVIWYNICVIVVLVACFVITALVAAAEAENKAFSFVAIWTMLLQAVYTVGLYFLYKRAELRSAFSVGLLVGISGMMAMANLTLAVFAASSTAEFGGIVHSQRASERAVTAFTIMLMLAELFLVGLLLTNLHLMVPDSSEPLNATPAPPAFTGTAGEAPAYDTEKLTTTTDADTYEDAPSGEADAADVAVSTEGDTEV